MVSVYPKVSYVWPIPYRIQVFWGNIDFSRIYRQYRGGQYIGFYRDPPPNPISITILAHSLQLLLADLEDTPLVRGSLQTMETLLETLEARELQIKLKEVQKAAGHGEGKLHSPARANFGAGRHHPFWSDTI